MFVRGHDVEQAILRQNEQRHGRVTVLIAKSRVGKVLGEPGRLDDGARARVIVERGKGTVFLEKLAALEMLGRGVIAEPVVWVSGASW